MRLTEKNLSFFASSASSSFILMPLPPFVATRNRQTQRSSSSRTARHRQWGIGDDYITCYEISGGNCNYHAVFVVAAVIYFFLKLCLYFTVAAAVQWLPYNMFSLTLFPFNVNVHIAFYGYNIMRRTVPIPIYLALALGCRAAPKPNHYNMYTNIPTHNAYIICLFLVARRMKLWKRQSHQKESII